MNTNPTEGTNMNTTTTEAPALITQIREGDDLRLKPLKDAFVALWIANRDLRNCARELREATDELFEQATTGHCYPHVSTHGKTCNDPTEWAHLMASNASAQANTIKTIHIVAEALFGVRPDKQAEIEEAVRYVVDNSTNWDFTI